MPTLRKIAISWRRNSFTATAAIIHKEQPLLRPGVVLASSVDALVQSKPGLNQDAVRR